jgi:hypothetical protein
LAIVGGHPTDPRLIPPGNGSHRWAGERQKPQGNLQQLPQGIGGPHLLWEASMILAGNQPTAKPLGFPHNENRAQVPQHLQRGSHAHGQPGARVRVSTGGAQIFVRRTSPSLLVTARTLYSGDRCMAAVPRLSRKAAQLLAISPDCRGRAAGTFAHKGSRFPCSDPPWAHYLPRNPGFM